MFKKLFISGILLAMIFSLPFSVLAKVGAGIKPNSSFYFLDSWFEGIRLFFIFNNENKAYQILSYSNERVAEIIGLSSQESFENLKKAADKYHFNILSAVNYAKNLSDKSLRSYVFGVIIEHLYSHQQNLFSIIDNFSDENQKLISDILFFNKSEQESAMAYFIEANDEILSLE